MEYDLNKTFSSEGISYKYPKDSPKHQIPQVKGKMILNEDNTPYKSKKSSIILHRTGGKGSAGLRTMLSDKVDYSAAHYYIDESGSIVQLTDDDNVVFHAGKSNYKGKMKGEINGRSVSPANINGLGIEFAGKSEGEPLTKQQIKTGAILLAEKVKQLGIPLDKLEENILGHAQITQFDDNREMIDSSKVTSKNNYGRKSDFSYTQTAEMIAEVKKILNK